MVECEGMIPTNRGYQVAPNLTNFDTAQLPVDNQASYPKTARMIQKLDGTARIFAFSPAAIYERTSAGWVDRYTNPATLSGEWTVRQFGDVTLAGSNGFPIAASTSTTFAAVTGSPSAFSMVITTTGQVMVVGYAAQADGWKCSGLFDHTLWTPSAATQSAEGQFRATPGRMTGAIEFGPHVVAFKERSMYWMRYANVPLIWATEVISNEVGALSNDCIVDVGDQIMFIGTDDIYRFDGTRPVPIGAHVREWFFKRLNWFSRGRIQGVYDSRSQLVWWWYPENDSFTISAALVFHVPTGRWGHARIQGSAPLIMRESSVIEQGYGSAVFSEHVLGIISDGKLFALTELSSTAIIRLGWFGDDGMASTLTKIRPRFLKSPVATPSALFYKTENLDEEEYVGSAMMSEKAFHTKQNATWHSAQLRIPSGAEIAGIATDLPRASGKR